MTNSEDDDPDAGSWNSILGSLFLGSILSVSHESLRNEHFGVISCSAVSYFFFAGGLSRPIRSDTKAVVVDI